MKIRYNIKKLDELIESYEEDFIKEYEHLQDEDKLNRIIKNLNHYYKLKDYVKNRIKENYMLLKTEFLTCIKKCSFIALFGLTMLFSYDYTINKILNKDYIWTIKGSTFKQKGGFFIVKDFDFDDNVYSKEIRYRFNIKDDENYPNNLMDNRLDNFEIDKDSNVFIEYNSKLKIYIPIIYQDNNIRMRFYIKSETYYLPIQILNEFRSIFKLSKAKKQDLQFLNIKHNKKQQIKDNSEYKNNEDPELRVEVEYLL